MDMAPSNKPTTGGRKIPPVKKRREEMTDGSKKIMIIIGIISCAAYILARVHYSNEFTKECDSFILTATKTNDPEVALIKLNTAIAYAQDHRLTHGYTSLFYNTEDENLSFWYSSLNAAYQSLQEIITPKDNKTVTHADISTTITSVRQSLLTTASAGMYGSSEVTISPNGISIYPYKWIYFVWALVSLAMIIIPIIVRTRSRFDAAADATMIAMTGIGQWRSK